jgi:hypothetical protein
MERDDDEITADVIAGYEPERAGGRHPLVRGS